MIQLNIFKKSFEEVEEELFKLDQKQSKDHFDLLDDIGLLFQNNFRSRFFGSYCLPDDPIVGRGEVVKSYIHLYFYPKEKDANVLTLYNEGLHVATLTYQLFEEGEDNDETYTLNLLRFELEDIDEDDELYKRYRLHYLFK